MPKKKMGEMLLEMGIIDQKVLEQALELQKGSNQRLGEILEDMDQVIEEDVAKVLGEQFGIPHVKGIARYRFPEEILLLVDAETAISRFVFPLKVKGKVLYLAMSDPLDISLQEDLSFKVNLRISPCVATSEEIKTAIKKHYLKGPEGSQEDRSWNVLVVDNQQISLAATVAVLKKEGYTVYKANNGAEGLRMAAEVHPHLIITDITMPRMGGVEMFNALKKNRELHKTPIIALSSKASVEEEFNLLEMGFFDFIAKPLNPLRLAARAKRAMRYIQGAS